MRPREFFAAMAMGAIEADEDLREYSRQRIVEAFNKEIEFMGVKAPRANFVNLEGLGIDEIECEGEMNVRVTDDGKGLEIMGSKGLFTRSIPMKVRMKISPRAATEGTSRVVHGLNGQLDTIMEQTQGGNE